MKIKVSTALIFDQHKEATPKANPIQAKLISSQPGDFYEQEANRIAENVIRSTKPLPRRQTIRTIGQGRSVDAPGSVHEALRSPGEPLDTRTRMLMEPRFGYDFGSILVHTDTKAAESARAIQATAYTIGRDIVFGQGQYAPDTSHGASLLAHELTHTIQQNNRPVGLQCVSAGEQFARFIGFEGTFDHQELQDYLTFLNTNSQIEDNYDSDNKARAVVRKWTEGASGYTLSPQLKILLIQEMLSGFTGDDDEAAILDIIANSPDGELTTIFNQVSVQTIKDDMDGEEERQFDRLIAGYNTRTGTLSGQDLLASTHTVTPTEHTVVESTLTGSTLVQPPATSTSSTSTGTASLPPAPVMQQPPLMTGLPTTPGVPGAFENDMGTAMHTYLSTTATAFRTLQSAGPASFPVTRANNIALAAQNTTEEHFSPYIRVASRGLSGIYTPGIYSLSSVIHDQSQVSISPGTRSAWTDYWMQQDFTGGEAVMTTYNCEPSLRSPDDTEFAAVKSRFAADPANQTDIDDTIHSWPAEATGGVNIQPYRQIASTDDERRTRWDIFTTLIHEFMHILDHPNYERAYNLIGGTGQLILREGMADVMRRDLWDGPGQLESRLATSEYAPVRRQIEGNDYPYDSNVVVYHGDYSTYSDALDIVNGTGGQPGVGMENAKAAFFMGHTELLGLGAGTSTTGGVSLANIAMYSATDSADAEIVVVAAGDSYAAIQSRTHAPANGILDEASGTALAAGATLTPGQRLRVPGIRHIYAIQDDTLDSIAAQNGVSIANLIMANNLPPGTAGTYSFPVGTRVLIPIHP